MVCSFNILYIEPLDETASAKFVKDNFSYFGEPLALMLASLYNCMAATLLWVFGAYGFGCGIIFSMALLYSILRITVVYIYLAQWKNPYIDAKEEENRKHEAVTMVVAGGTVKARRTCECF